MPVPSLRGWRALLLFSCLTSVSAVEAAGPPVAPEYQVKAAFLFQFSRFVQWPPDSFSSADARLVICVLGVNPFGSALQEIAAGEAVQTHPLSVERRDRVEDLTDCHIVFVSGRDEDVTRQALGYLSGRRVLTVSDSDDFARRGGIIGLVTVDGAMIALIDLPNLLTTDVDAGKLIEQPAVPAAIKD